MLFSLCTPTNNATYLRELYDSITAQTYDKREWVLVLN
jgi:glycosyltransferase involved in cell wall biosynthesis